MTELRLPTFDIAPLDQANIQQIQQRIDNKTKPPGALGQLESLAAQIAQIQNAEGKQGLDLNNPTMVVFAADHGIADEGVSIAPSVVTQQMVHNFLNGGAAINCFCKTSNMSIKVVDAGILSSIEHPDLISQRLGAGTNNFVSDKAMSEETVVSGLLAGAETIRSLAGSGCNVVGFGEMGIGNTSSAAALMSALLDKPVDECVGRGTGIDDESLAKKVRLIEQAMTFHRADLKSPLTNLACVGGFEIVQMVGAILAAAESKMIVLIDGFIATAAALYANALVPAARDYMVFCHQSHEQGHRAMLDYLEGKPLLDLELRLGEGTGAALAYPLLQAAVKFYNDMASFESAGVEAV